MGSRAPEGQGLLDKKFGGLRGASGHPHLQDNTATPGPCIRGTPGGREGGPAARLLPLVGPGGRCWGGLSAISGCPSSPSSSLFRPPSPSLPSTFLHARLSLPSRFYLCSLSYSLSPMVCSPLPAWPLCLPVSFVFLSLPALEVLLHVCPCLSITSPVPTCTHFLPHLPPPSSQVLSTLGETEDRFHPAKDERGRREENSQPSAGGTVG